MIQSVLCSIHIAFADTHVVCYCSEIHNQKQKKPAGHRQGSRESRGLGSWMMNRLSVSIWILRIRVGAPPGEEEEKYKYTGHCLGDGTQEKCGIIKPHKWCGAQQLLQLRTSLIL
nr:uncharacterized protein LOC113690261 [Coffea arabica]